MHEALGSSMKLSKEMDNVVTDYMITSNHMVNYNKHFVSLLNDITEILIKHTENFQSLEKVIKESIDKKKEGCD